MGVVGELEAKKFRLFYATAIQHVGQQVCAFFYGLLFSLRTDEIFLIRRLLTLSVTIV